MALTPYASLANLPEVIAADGKIPPGFLADPGSSPRTVTLSEIAGITCDCNLLTGLTWAGGAILRSVGVANAALINAVLASTTARHPVHLVVDTGCAIGNPITIPPGGNVTITGLGWSTGFFVLSASNCNAIQTSNVGPTDLAHFNAVHPSGPQSITSSNVTLANFKINANRGTYPTGCVSGYAGDGTLTSNGAYANDARGPANYYFLTGVTLVGVDNLVFDRLWCYDAPAYSISLYHCTNVEIRKSRFECVDSSVDNNTDGIHLNGGCSFVLIDGCYVKAGDDAFAINLHEGDATAGSDITITNCVINALTIGRVYGIATTPSRRVRFSGLTGSVRWWGLLIGQGNTEVDNVVDSNHVVMIRDFDVQITVGDGPLPPALFLLAANCGILDVSGIAISDPVVAHSVVFMTSLTGTVGSLTLADVKVRRSAGGSAAVNLLSGVSGTVQCLEVSGWSISDAGSFDPILNFLVVASPCSITQFWAANINPAHVAAFVDHPAQVGAKAGPGLAASGF